MIYRFFVFSLILFSALNPLYVNAEIHKWVDEKGVTHYGSFKPSKKNSTQVSITDNTIDTKRGKKLRSDEDETIDCDAAVKTAHISIDILIEGGKEMVDNKEISDKQYNQTTAKLEKMKSKITKPSCIYSEGNIKDFYRCMSSGQEFAPTCGKRHGYWF